MVKTSESYALGRAARNEGKTRFDNPYDPEKVEKKDWSAKDWNDWDCGWLDTNASLAVLAKLAEGA